MRQSFLTTQSGEPVVGGGENVFVFARRSENLFQVACVSPVQFDEHSQDRHVAVPRRGSQPCDAYSKFQFRLRSCHSEHSEESLPLS
jgi:hypothetical protein